MRSKSKDSNKSLKNQQSLDFVNSFRKNNLSKKSSKLRKSRHENETRLQRNFSIRKRKLSEKETLKRQATNKTKNDQKPGDYIETEEKLLFDKEEDNNERDFRKEVPRTFTKGEWDMFIENGVGVSERVSAYKIPSNFGIDDIKTLSKLNKEMKKSKKILECSRVGKSYCESSDSKIYEEEE